MPYDTVTLAKDTVHNPSEPRHFMRLRPLNRRVLVHHGDRVVADTIRALRVLEVGFDLYEPVLYIPPADVTPHLARNPEFSHCPLKGDAVYFDLLAEDGRIDVRKMAWSYPRPFDFADTLRDRIAFYPEHVSVEERPLG